MKLNFGTSTLAIVSLICAAESVLCQRSVLQEINLDNLKADFTKSLPKETSLPLTISGHDERIRSRGNPSETRANHKPASADENFLLKRDISRMTAVPGQQIKSDSATPLPNIFDKYLLPLSSSHLETDESSSHYPILSRSKRTLLLLKGLFLKLKLLLLLG